MEANGLDAHIIKTNSKMFPGFRLYEDFGESNRARIDAMEDEKLKVTDVIRSITERSNRAIAEEPAAGKRGINVRAVRFVRLLAERHHSLYGTPLNGVVATAANALFDTRYTDADVSNLVR